MGKGSSLKEVPLATKKRKFFPLDKAQTANFLSNFFYVGPLGLEFCEEQENDFHQTTNFEEPTFEIKELFPSEWFPSETPTSLTTTSPVVETPVVPTEKPTIIAQIPIATETVKAESDACFDNYFEDLLQAAEFETAKESSYNFTQDEDHFLSMSERWEANEAKTVYKKKKGGIVVRSKKENKHEKAARSFMTRGPRLVSLSHPSNIVTIIPQLDKKASPATPNSNFDTDLQKAMSLSLNEQKKTAAPPVNNNAPTAAQVNNAVSKSYLNTIGLTPQQVQELFTRELTPEDYELLLLLDASVKPKTVAQSTLSGFKSFTLSADDPRKGSICAICMDEFAIGDQIKELPCKHFFHGNCVDVWLSNNSTICPVDGLPVS